MSGAVQALSVSAQNAALQGRIYGQASHPNEQDDKAGRQKETRQNQGNRLVIGNVLVVATTAAHAKKTPKYGFHGA